MKKTIGTIALLAACMVGAETVKAQKTTFGVRAGINFQNINGKDLNGNKLNYNIIPGFNVGVNSEIPLAPTFYLQPGVLISTKGAKWDVAENNNVYTQTTRIAYLEVPVNFMYKPQLGSGHLLTGLGPYLEVGLAGKVKYEGNGAPADRDVAFSSSLHPSEAYNDVNYRRVGAGANFLFGYEFANRLSAQLNAQLGLTNINPENVRGNAKNTGFGISVGYRF